MRTYGRITNADGTKTWIEIQTDANGYDDYVYLTTLVQVLKLNLGESPFYADFGIPAYRSVLQQVQPDFYVNRTQQRFAPRFASLTVAKVPAAEPTYLLNVTTHQGATLQAVVAE